MPKNNQNLIPPGTLVLLPPDRCMPPHTVSHPNFLTDLANEFQENGWGQDYPSLVAYPWEGKIQLLSGSHRWAAAMMAQLPWIPTVQHSYDTVSRAWGNSELWTALMKTGDGVSPQKATLRYF